MTSSLVIQRRSLLKGLGVLFGVQAAQSLLGGNALSVAMAFAQSAPRQLQVFSAEQMRVLAIIGDLTIPQTDTPGALATDSHWFVDNQLKHCFATETQTSAKQILDKIITRAQALLSLPFTDATKQQQLTLLQALESSQSGFDGADTKAFKQLKALLVFGFFTSKVGMTQLLQYDPVPGGFKGSVAYASVGKAYSGGFPF